MNTKLIVRIVAGACVLVALYLVTTSIWWTGRGYCFGSMTKCVGL